MCVTSMRSNSCCATEKERGYRPLSSYAWQETERGPIFGVFFSTLRGGWFGRKAKSRAGVGSLKLRSRTGGLPQKQAVTQVVSQCLGGEGAQRTVPNCLAGESGPCQPLEPTRGFWLFGGEKGKTHPLELVHDPLPTGGRPGDILGIWFRHGECTPRWALLLACQLAIVKLQPFSSCATRYMYLPDPHRRFLSLMSGPFLQSFAHHRAVQMKPGRPICNGTIHQTACQVSRSPALVEAFLASSLGSWYLVY